MFLDPAPRVIVDLFVDLLKAEVQEVQLEDLKDPLPVFRLSPAGIRLYVDLSAMGVPAAAIN